MARNYKWGIMGAGVIARKMAGALRQEKDAELCFVASKSDERAKTFAQEQDVPGYGSYEELVNDSSIDIIYVATTHNFHRENARMAMEHGKHVLIEKPFTVNAGETDDLISLAKEKNVFLMEAIWTRFLPSYVKLKSLLDTGSIGDVRHLDVSFGNYALPQYEGRLKDPALAGGVTLDMGIYPISFCCYMLNEIPVDIQSMCRFSDRGVDEVASYQFRFPSGAIAQIRASFALKMENRAALFGTKGYVLFPGFCAGDEFTVFTHNGTNEIQNQEAIHMDREENGFIYQVQEVQRCLEAGQTESSVITLKETREIMAVMDSMRTEWGLKYDFEK
jgi:dihydrodiol dehydrogenase / D-xylose 1-dehydrogenase (NADP)